MWVRVWLRVRVVCCVCVWAGVWNMWAFAGEWDDSYRHWFTRGRPCPGLFKTCQVPGLGNDARLQDHAKAPWGLAGVADAGIQRIYSLLCWQENLLVSVCPKKVLVKHLLPEQPHKILLDFITVAWVKAHVWYDCLCCCLFILLNEVWGRTCDLKLTHCAVNDSNAAPLWQPMTSFLFRSWPPHNSSPLWRDFLACLKNEQALTVFSLSHIIYIELIWSSLSQLISPPPKKRHLWGSRKQHI